MTIRELIVKWKTVAGADVNETAYFTAVNECADQLESLLSIADQSIEARRAERNCPTLTWAQDTIIGRP